MTTKTSSLSGKAVRVRVRARAGALARALAVLLLCTSHPRSVVDALRATPQLSGPKTVGGLPVHRTPLRKEAERKDPPATNANAKPKPTTAPYCFSLSSILDLPSRSNFLATQVWPSARVAATTLEERLWFGRGSSSDRDGNGNGNGKEKEKGSGNSSGSGSGERSLWNLSNREEPFTICELGCGPGLPSIAAAAAAAAAAESSSSSSSTLCGAGVNVNVNVRVVATDVDSFGLELVDAAANEQGLGGILETRRVDLIEAGTDSFWADPENDWIRETVDLFVLSDVFESEAVAVGAARLTERVLSGNNENLDDKNNDDHASVGRRLAPKQKSVWVFAQTDRVQREVYLRELRRLLGADSNNDNDDNEGANELRWSSPDSYTLEDSLWLCDVDETLVKYG